MHTSIFFSILRQHPLHLILDPNFKYTFVSYRFLVSPLKAIENFFSVTNYKTANSFLLKYGRNYGIIYSSQIHLDIHKMSFYPLRAYINSGRAIVRKLEPIKLTAVYSPFLRLLETVDI